MTRSTASLALLALLMSSVAALAQAPPAAPAGGAGFSGEPMSMLIYRSPVIAVCLITEGNDVAPAADGPEEADKPAGKPPLRPTATGKVVRAIAGVKQDDSITLSVGAPVRGPSPLVLKRDEQWLLFMGEQHQGRYPIVRAARVVDDKVIGFQIRKSDYALLVIDGEMPLAEAEAVITKAIDDHAAAAKYDVSPEAKTADQLLADISDNDELNLKIVGALTTRRACPQLLTLVKAPPSGIMLYAMAIRALGHCPGEASEDVLIPLLSSENLAVFGSAAEALGQMKSKRAVEPLLARARAEKGILSYPLARALASTGDPRAIDPLLEARKRIIAAEQNGPGAQRPWLRLQYLGLLRGFDDPRVKEVAKEELQSDDRAAVLLAADLLHDQGDPAGIERLLALLEQDTSYANQSQIIARLSRMKDEKAVPALIKLVAESKDDHIRAQAANALSMITGERFGEDAAQWQQWWDKHKG